MMLRRISCRANWQAGRLALQNSLRVGPSARQFSSAAAPEIEKADHDVLEPSQIRNVAIIAHVDHGKTTLMDRILRECGANVPQERAMDSITLERERGITIASKYTSIFWKGMQMNVVDTPGHADFGGEVERVVGMVEGAVLVVDAGEGPLAQTKFVVAKVRFESLPAPRLPIGKFLIILL